MSMFKPMAGRYRDDMIEVRIRMDMRSELEQLAEESAELAQAAIKMIRATGLSKSPTPVKLNDAWSDVVEEAGDVLMLLDLLGAVDIDTSDNPKWERWARRLRGK